MSVLLMRLYYISLPPSREGQGVGLLFFKGRG